MLYYYWHYCILLKVLWYQGFPNGVGLWGNNLGKMAKNCMKIIKSTFGRTVWDMGGKPIFRVVGGGGIPPVPPLGETLIIKGTMSLRVLLAQSLSHLVDYEKRKVGRK